MPFFIKTETMTKSTLALSIEERKQFLSKHKAWVESLTHSKVLISSGYLVNKFQEPGGGGLMILKARSFQEAENFIKQDPLILAGLVSWKLQEWIPVAGELIQ